MDEYTFIAAPGTVVFFEEVSGSCSFDWECHDANDTEIFSDGSMCNNHPGTHTLTLGGEYTISVFGAGASTGTYSFFIWSVEPPDEIAISLDENVSDGFPGEGAGNLEEPGQVDVYTFEVASLADVCFEEITGACNFNWTCLDPDSNEIFDDSSLCLNSPGRFQLATPGTYTLTVFADGAANGTYSFVVNTGKAADYDGDCDVDVNDLLTLLAGWGTPDADVTGDGNTDVLDLLDLLSEWG